MDSAVVKIARYVISSPEDVTTATARGRWLPTRDDSRDAEP